MKKNNTLNPKDVIGSKKPDLTLVPQSAIVYTADALKNGAKKYGAYNWRDYKVEVRTYIAAAQRHLACYLDGEEKAEDSGVHHLGHALASISILVDALECGSFIDNRPSKGQVSSVIDKLTIKTK